MKRDNKDVSYADVIVDISHESVDRPFTYRIPDALRGKLETGMSVLIPFGRGDKLRQGYVTAFRDSISFEESKVKEIADIAETDTAVDAILVRLAGWIRQQYGSTMIAALKTVLPAKQKKQNLEKKQICRRISGEEAKARKGFRGGGGREKYFRKKPAGTQPGSAEDRRECAAGL